MRCSSILAVFLFATQASATCFVCDEVVELTDRTAACFEENFGTLMEALAAEPTGRLSVNLAACEGTDAAARREGLLEMGELPVQQGQRIKSVYILDEASVLCLRDLITGYGGPFDPSVTFDLFEACNGE